MEEWRCTACKRVRKPGDSPLQETLTPKFMSGKCNGKCRARRMFERVPQAVWDGHQIVEGEQLKQEGMEKALSNAKDGTDAAWVAEANRAADILIVQRRDFTVEDIVSRAGLPTNRNATGAFMNGLARSGRIALVGYRKGTRESQHARRIAVWRAT